MATIILNKGEKLNIQFQDSDGEIEVGFVTGELYVKADMPDTQGRSGVIYSEQWMIEVLATGGLYQVDDEIHQVDREALAQTLGPRAFDEPKITEPKIFRSILSGHYHMLLTPMAFRDMQHVAAKGPGQLDAWLVWASGMWGCEPYPAIQVGKSQDEPHDMGDEETPEDSPSLDNCDDAGTGEGKYHGRM